MFNYIDVAHFKSSNFNNISYILGIGYGLLFNRLFKFIKLFIKVPVLFLVWAVQNMPPPINSN